MLQKKHKIWSKQTSHSPRIPNWTLQPLPKQDRPERPSSHCPSITDRKCRGGVHLRTVWTPSPPSVQNKTAPTPNYNSVTCESWTQNPTVLNIHAKPPLAKILANYRDLGPAHLFRHDHGNPRQLNPTVTTVPATTAQPSVTIENNTVTNGSLSVIRHRRSPAQLIAPP